MTTEENVGTEIAREVADDPELAARMDDLLHRACSLARALTDAEPAAYEPRGLQTHVVDALGHALRRQSPASAFEAVRR